MTANRANVNQNWAAVLLILALIAIVCVGVLRVKGAVVTSGVKAANRQASRSSATVEIRDSVVPEWSPDQNPFAKPSELRLSEDSTESKPLKVSSLETKPLMAWTRRTTVLPVLPPADSYRFIGAESTPTTANELIDTPKLPEAVLLTVVKGPNGRVCVIKLGNGPAQTVSEGDTLADGFKVKCVGENYAVLTNGRNDILAKRPGT